VLTAFGAAMRDPVTTISCMGASATLAAVAGGCVAVAGGCANAVALTARAASPRMICLLNIDMAVALPEI
jgi:hypothetical protein